MLSSHVKFSADRQADRRTDRRTPVKQYAPDLSMRGHKSRVPSLIRRHNKGSQLYAIYSNGVMKISTFHYSRTVLQGKF